DSFGLYNTRANVVRLVLSSAWNVTTTTESVRQYIDTLIAHHVVAVPGYWEGTCSGDPALLQQIVDRWIADAAYLKTIERHVILDVANEWGPADSTVWRDQYIAALARLRAAGINATLMIDSGGCGQDANDLVSYARAVADSDPQHNVIF